MCGILFYKQNENENISKNDLLKLKVKLNNISSRGPDETKDLLLENKYFGFTRLSINGLDKNSGQPLIINDVILICNGEIYNYKELLEENNFDYKTKSDCEIIIHMYNKYGIDNTIKKLDGVFSFILFDKKNNNIYVGRDPIGIRPLFYIKNNNNISFCSEMKGLDLDLDLNENINQFKPGHYYDVNEDKFVSYFDNSFVINDVCYNDCKLKINELLNESVKKRLLSDRPVACLLSGGLDSTIITALVSKYYENYKLNTYSIGMKGSVDLKYANIAAKYLKTNHKSIELTENEFLDAIEETIYVIESYDVTTVRASVGNYLVSKYIKENSDDTVIFCGDVSDEIFGSYRGFTKAENNERFKEENDKMLNNIHYFDVLRSDRCISGAGLEARVPFADKKFLSFVMSINPSFKMFNKDIIEKKILREAFEGLLPDELLYRRKEAFSDGVSSHERGWFQIIKDHVDLKYSDNDFISKKNKYDFNQPYDKESLYYREIFEKYYKNCGKIIPYFWKHPFCSEIDPSARLLAVY